MRYEHVPVAWMSTKGGGGAMSKERELLKRVRDTLHELKETHYDLYWDIQAELDLAPPKREIKGNVMNKEQALRILKMLSSLEVVVFQNNANVPDHVIDELIDVVDMLTDIVLEKDK